MKSLGKYIDHTLLKATATKADIVTLCEEAIIHEFHSVCVNSCYVSLVSEELLNKTVDVCSVIGFPLGAMSSKAKLFEAEKAFIDGADEIDMVLNLGFLKSKNYIAVSQEIRSVKNILPNNILKVILETCYLSDEEILETSRIAMDNGADFLKTSTGFGSGGATEHHVKLIKSITANTHVKIKASGGIRDTETALRYIKLGADRIGTSSGIAIVQQKLSNDTY